MYKQFVITISLKPFIVHQHLCCVRSYVFT